MKKHKIIFWTTTILLFIMEGPLQAFTSQMEMAKEELRHLGYPEYFGCALVVFKVFGALALITPQVPKRLKEWAYAGFLFDFVFAFISHFVTDGMSIPVFPPLIFLGLLAASYNSYHRLNLLQKQGVKTPLPQQ